MATFVYLTAVSVSCLLFAPVTEATTRLLRFSNTGLDSLVFTNNVLFETTSRSVLDCGRQCVRDARCVTFTRVKGSSSGSCRGHAAIFTSTSAHFVSATGATTFSWPGGWLNQTCSADSECPGAYSDCFEGRCLCSPGYYFSVLHGCVAACAQSDLQRTFLQYPGSFIAGHNTQVIASQSLEKCLEQCRKSVECRTVEYDHTASMCYTQTKTKLDIPATDWRTGYSEYSLYQKMCA